MGKTDSNIFHALGNETRLKIMEILGNGEAHVSELARELDISVPAVAKHIRLLEKSGLVKRRVYGKSHVLSSNKAVALVAVDSLAPVIKVEVEKGCSLLEALESVASVEIRKKGDREMIMSTNGDEGFYIYEINGKLGKSSVRKCRLEENMVIEWKKLEPVTKIRLNIHVKK